MLEDSPAVPSVNALAHNLRVLAQVAKYLCRRRGLLARSSSHVGIFCKSHPAVATPDIQFHVLPATSKRSMEKLKMLAVDREPGLTIAPCQLRPSRVVEFGSNRTIRTTLLRSCRVISRRRATSKSLLWRR